ALQMAQVIIDRSPVILFRRIAGAESHLVYVSENIKQWGYTADDFYSEKISFPDIVHPEDDQRVDREVKQFTGQDVEEYTQYYRIVTQAGQTRWVEDQTSVERDQQGRKIYHQGVLVDITERREAEAKLRKSEEKYRRIVETTGEGFLLMDRDLRITDMNAAYCRMLGYSREELLGRIPMELASEESRRYLMAHHEELLSQDDRKMEFDLEAKDGRLIPVLIHGNTLWDDRGRVIGNMAFVTDMTEHRKALRLAAEVQKSLLPMEKPRFPGLDVAGKNVSCDEVGGDYFDFLWQRDTPRDPFQVVVGDIAGHGVDSALLMTSARAFLRMRASQPGSPAEVITAMNRHLARDVLESGRFMTLFYMRIDRERDRIAWVRAGHDAALIFDPRQDRFQELMGHGVALGVDESFVYGENQWSGLSEGQIIAVGTDGLWESHDRQGRMFGKERLRAIIRRHAHAGADEILAAVFAELGTFMNGLRHEDDITLVVIKVKRP
ncbi:MAG: SpoIIE family protein phosphatase, partial [Desulfobacterales bacterium]